jgi:hypothetical protein
MQKCLNKAKGLPFVLILSKNIRVSKFKQQFANCFPPRLPARGVHRLRDALSQPEANVTENEACGQQNRIMWVAFCWGLFACFW